MKTTRNDTNPTPVNSIDSVHALNVLFCGIVLFLHHVGYANNYFEFLEPIGMNRWLQQFAVGGFLYLSGYKLALSKTDTPPFTFIRNRLIRLYPPYLFVTLIMLIMVYIQNGELFTLKSLSHIIVHVTCLQALLPDLFDTDIVTVWFVSVLFVCYGYFLLTRKYLKHTHRFFLILASVALMFLFLEITSKGWNIQFIREDMTTWIMFFGVGMASAIWSRKNQNTRLVLVVTSVSAIVTYVVFRTILKIDTWYYKPIDYTLMLASCIPLYYLSITTPTMSKLQPKFRHILAEVSYATYFMYLLHRPVWRIMRTVWATGSIWQ